jgi:hypothetical protein
VWSFGIVLSPPLFNLDLCLFEAVNDFIVDQFIAGPGVETLAGSVLPSFFENGALH